MLLFQFPEAEDLLRKDDWALVREWMASHPDLDDAIERLAEPGALTAALNWYRASMHPRNELRGAELPERRRAHARDLEQRRRLPARGRR